MLLQGKVAIITGAGSGVGRASALRFAEEGASVICADIDLDRAKETVAQLEAAGGTAIAERCDVSDDRDVAATVATAVDRCRPFGHHVQQRRHPDAPTRYGVRGSHGRGLSIASPR